tara:strand:+ start:152 stop:703 length:552 start_codon:yes stop_codon:yes gene_type:complete
MNDSSTFKDIQLLKTTSYIDERGFFSEIYNKKEMEDSGIKNNFIQDNLSFSKKRGVIRGLHFQKNTFAQSKLLRVLEGQIQDVFIDLRPNSETYEISGFEILTQEKGWIYIPHGFAHGFCTLTDNVKILYKVDSYYSAEMDSGIRWNDNFFNIEWMVDDDKAIISEKDRGLPLWNDIKKETEF